MEKTSRRGALKELGFPSAVGKRKRMKRPIEEELFRETQNFRSAQVEDINNPGSPPLRPKLV